MENCAFLDYNDTVTVSTIDFMPFDLASNVRFAAVVHEALQTLLP